MDEVIAEILNRLREGELDNKSLDLLLRKQSQKIGGSNRLAKKNILPYFLAKKTEDSDVWKTWNVSSDLEERFIKTLQMKPRRSASGVATITVITKPWTCSGHCIFCPNDVRMPKSYLHDEPACQRAERNYFDPYLQVASRLQALNAMGHATDKIELIILGGSWSDYPEAYRFWFITELFRCLNDTEETRKLNRQEREKLYQTWGIQNVSECLKTATNSLQHQINEGQLSFNEAIKNFYFLSPSWEKAENYQKATLKRVEKLQRQNEEARHRVVGLVIETRPQTITAESLVQLRSLGATKIQMGIQSLHPDILARNGRPTDINTIVNALDLCRLFGFKTHIHFMMNLLGSTPETDKEDYSILVEDARFKPDEVKLYPCALVDGTKLMDFFREGLWQPYTEEELLDVLCTNMLVTPPFMRISRMIRDISAKDIVVGNKKTNLRQMVDIKLQPAKNQVNEIRYRELACDNVNLSTLQLTDTPYETNATEEHFLQWITPDNKIVGFLRLSLPKANELKKHGDVLPIKPQEAMIREVHVYGFAAKIERKGSSAQHHGLGKKLIEKACSIAKDAGFTKLNVISAIGTRNYYRKQGFADNGLYQQKQL